MLIGVFQTPTVVRDVDAVVDAVREFAANADAADSNLLLFPECFLQGYLVDDGHARRLAFEVGSAVLADVLARLARITQTLVLGMLERAGSSYYNTALVIAAGRVLGGYPQDLPDRGESVFAFGDRYPIFECAGVRVCGMGSTSVCYDAQSPEATAGVAAGGADLFVVADAEHDAEGNHFKIRHAVASLRNATRFILGVPDLRAEQHRSRLADGT